MTLPPQPSEQRFTERAVILGAGLPVRGQRPSALHGLGDQGRVLDWLVSALRACSHDVIFVGGYRLQEIVSLYPGLGVVLNADWEQTGPVGSLLRGAAGVAADCLMSYADVLYRETLVRELCRHAADTVIAVDTRWRERYDSRSPADMASAEVVMAEGGWLVSAHGRLAADRPVHAYAEFVGLARLGPLALRHLAAWATDPAVARWDIPRLLNALVVAGVPVATVDCRGDWAELNAAQDVARFVLGTKAQTLERLRPMVTRSLIGRQVAFTVADWRAAPEDTLAVVRAVFGDDLLVVRSSALGEDGFLSSGAGRYLSVLDVPSNDGLRVREAVEQVIASYGDGNPAHQVLVQRLIGDVALSGVVMTRTLSHGAPYRVINYDASSDDPASVTSGHGRELRTVYLHRDESLVPEGVPAALQAVLDAVEEVERLVGYDCLDIEFIVSSQGAVHVLQIRPIAVDHGQWRGTDELVRDALSAARRDFRQLQSAGDGVLGEHTVFSVMSDWNPAEMIGTRPGRLAYSLYSELVTREVWAAQRAEYGYRDLRPMPLMHNFAGHPYIDLRASLNSFVPAALDDGLAARLVSHYLDGLVARPELHDKIEFEIVFSCLDFGFDARARGLAAAGFAEAEIARLRDSLRHLTLRGIDRVTDDRRALARLAERQHARLDDGSPLRRALALLDDARRHGTLPFAHLARAGFIATALLRSAVTAGILDEDEHHAYLADLDTVATEFREASLGLQQGAVSLQDFLQRFGHLRPGTYDLTVPSYAEAPARYLREGSASPIVQAHRASGPAPWPAATRDRFTQALHELGLPVGFDRIDRFLREAIAGRELAKQVFTRNVSLALDLIARFGEEAGIRRDELAHLTLADLRSCSDGLWGGDVAGHLRTRCAEGALAHEIALGVELPPLIVSERDFCGFLSPVASGNFIGSASVTAPVIRLTQGQAPEVELQGRIVVTLQADPGYDWLFGHGIAGLVTAYGGANSHMAVRAAEFGMPAAIGVGEDWYQRLASGTRLILDGRQRSLTVLP